MDYMIDSITKSSAHKTLIYRPLFKHGAFSFENELREPLLFEGKSAVLALLTSSDL